MDQVLTQSPPQLSLSISYDYLTDIFTIEGVKYSGQMFRMLGVAEPGTWLRIDERKDQMLQLTTVSDSIGTTFDAIVGKGRKKR